MFGGTSREAGRAIAPVYGVVSTGSAWKFLQLEDTLLTIDVPEYDINNLPKVMGILRQLVDAA
jgi:hypothetical protein